MIERSYLQVISSRMKEPRKFIQVLMGPRQVGKTTLVSQLVKKIDIPHQMVSADAVPASDSNWLIQQWETARLSMKNAEAKEYLLVIDEIQKIENWSETVKLLWDEDSRNETSVKVILLGSSRLLLQQGLTESLAGRFETTYMGHWSFDEMREAFDWDVNQYTWFGGYPGSASLISDEARWKAYVSESLIETSISKDILMLTRVNKPALMKRLFELGCLYSGQILSYTKVMGQLLDAGNTTTLAHYLQLLDTAGLLAGIEKFDRKILRKRSSSPKFQVHNTALISAQRPESFSQILELPDQWGRMVESAVGAHLINASYAHGFNVHYWRSGRYEVDFVLENYGKVIGLEVKSGQAELKSNMGAFRSEIQPDRVFVIGEGGLPWEAFLSMDPIDLF